MNTLIVGTSCFVAGAFIATIVMLFFLGTNYNRYRKR